MDDMNLKEFEATVESIKDDKFVVLDQTAFYPLSGGVSYDTGVLIKNGEEFPVVYVWKFGEVISHEVSKQGLKEGDKVTGKIDWDRRYKLMRLHTTAHLIAAIMHNKAGALITGGKIEPDKARMDFSLEDFDREKIDEYIKLANELVQKDAKINVGYMKREEALKIPDMIKLANKMPPDVDVLRTVEIENIDKQADGGCHVSYIKEIGKISLIKVDNKGKSNRRLYYMVD
jgi:misacylated tRNA(Ala) deacylase|tara:strand:- start:3515 stop:4204 length:690 start_codon:yes stop_codon:yes gene_type:complete